MEASEEALAYIARLSDGGMRDAISLLEQVSAFSRGKITLEDAVEVTGGLAAEQFALLAEAIQERNVAALLPLVEGLMQAGKSPDKCLENLVYYFRDLLLIKLVPDGSATTERIVDPERFRAMADAYERDRLFRMIDILHQYQVELKHASQPQTLFEVALLKICTVPVSSGEETAASRSAEAAAPAAAGELASWNAR